MKPTSLSTPNDSIFQSGKKSFNYLAMGDSYTKGEGVIPEKNFPYQTVEKLAHFNLIFSPPNIIAETGWTTGELIHAMHKAEFGDTVFDLVTLLIGVNNQYRGQSLTLYEKEFKSLLETGLNLANGKPSQVMVISIPDWGVTRFGNSSGRNPEKISLEIDAFNQVNYHISRDFKVHYLEINKMYRMYGGLEKNLSSDGLHPSPLIYDNWASNLVNIILPHIQS
ncbi:MAG: GDSL-type esterase/lipase family protein [Cyclobacteriaceae bacterium]